MYPTLDLVQWVLIAPFCCELFLCADSTLITEMHVPSLPVSPDASKLVLWLLPVCYSHKYSSITEMHVPSLPVSPDASKLVVPLIPVCYSRKYSSNKAYVKIILITVRVLKSKWNSKQIGGSYVLVIHVHTCSNSWSFEFEAAHGYADKVFCVCVFTYKLWFLQNSGVFVWHWSI